MKNLIEIKIECKGNAVGTLGWFNSIIEKSELTIKNCKDGTPAIFLKTPIEEGKFKHKFICGVWDGLSDPAYYNQQDSFIWIFPKGDGFVHGFFDNALTPACKLKVEEFIDLAVEKFKEWWNNN